MASALPSWALKLNYWYIANKTKVRGWATISLLIVDGLLILTFVVRSTVYLASLPGRQQLFVDTFRSGLDWSAIKQRVAPSDLVVVAAAAVPPSGSDIVHLLADVKNPNSDWYVARLRYHWEYGGQNRPAPDATILPGQKKILATYSLDRAGGEATIAIDEIEWRRVDSPDQFSLPTFSFRNVTMTPLTDLGTQTAQLTGTVRNDTVNSFANVRVVAVLYVANQPVGVSEQRLSRLEGFSEQGIDLRWTIPVPANAQVDLRADVDTLEASALR